MMDAHERPAAERRVAQRRFRAVLGWVKRTGRGLGRVGYMLVGMPDYDNYVDHMRRCYPDQPVMSYSQFFRDRQQARYGGGKGRPVRCC